MKPTVFSRCLLAAVLAFTLSTFLYFSFGNLYSAKILNYEAFSAQFEAGIYRHRLLSTWLLEKIHAAVQAASIEPAVFKFKFFSTEAEPEMWLSYYLLNTVFLMLSAVIFTLITLTKSISATKSEQVILMAVAVFVMCFSQFVVVPYDISSYFFLLLFYGLFLSYLQNGSKKIYFSLLLLMALATLNRESSALSLAFAATALYNRFGFSKRFFTQLLPLTVVFILVYAGMRLGATDFTTNDGNLLQENFTEAKNYLGMLFWAVFFAFSLALAKDRGALRNILIFHFFALPYIFMCFYTGILYEIRLYVPLFLTSLLLARTGFPRDQIN